MVERIKITLEGLHEENGDVRLTEFSVVIDRIRAALMHANNHISGNRSAVLHLTGLSHNSPATATFENRQDTPGLLTAFGRALDSVGDGSAAQAIGYAALEDLYEISRRVTLKRVGGISINGATNNTTNFDHDYAARIQAELAPAEDCIGTVEGVLEALNLHGGANRFTIYPVSIDRGIKCLIPEALHDDALQHVRKKVAVTGKLRFRAQDFVPFQVDVEEIEGFPPDSELPTFEELRGMAPNMTGELSTEDYLEGLRDAWG